MARLSETKACDDCRKSKRRCGRQLPQCQRCWTKGLQCQYRASKPRDFILCVGEDEPQPQYLDQNGLVPAWTEIQPKSLNGTMHDVILQPEFPSPKQLDDAVSIKQHFWQPTTYDIWAIVPIPTQDFNNVSGRNLKRYIRTIQEWFAQWIKEGSNNFIHPQLYQFRFPRSIQDAFTTLATYLQRTSANEAMIFQIVLDRVGGLVSSQSAISSTLDPLEHLARVQALSVYQAICLHDGDVRMRHVGEGNILVLKDWLYQMIQVASQSPCLGFSLVWSNDSPPNAWDMVLSENLNWYSWIIAESCRRTWMTASSLQNIFMMVQLNTSLPCGGAMAFTASEGLWEAPSATAWEEQISAGNIGLVQMAHGADALDSIDFGNLNDFAKAFYEAAFGEDALRRYTRTLNPR
jgi:hypothetical protein